MMSALQIITGAGARAKALFALGLPSTAPYLDVQFELLRAVAWALTGGRRPVHILRLLNRALDTSVGLTDTNVEPESHRTSLRDALTALSDAGDLAELDGGNWVPSPSRIVEVRGGDRSLIVGGLPTFLLPVVARQGISRSGPFRYLDRSVVSTLSLPTEDVSEWARKPAEPLELWAKRILALELPEYSEPRDGSIIHLYLPARAHAGAPQFKRWFDRYSEANGKFLGRRRRVFGAIEYRLVEAAAGQLVRSGAVLAPREARRLMYAFDAWAGNPTRAKWMARSEEEELLLTSDLPEPEQRILGAMGTLELNSEKVYERRWRFVSRFDQVLRVLTELSINVEDDRRVRR